MVARLRAANQEIGKRATIQEVLFGATFCRGETGKHALFVCRKHNFGAGNMTAVLTSMTFIQEIS
eukprot:4285380-Prorocentrum_lima.AAC.1